MYEIFTFFIGLLSEVNLIEFKLDYESLPAGKAGSTRIFDFVMEPLLQF